MLKTCTKGWLAWVLNDPGCSAIEVCTLAGCSSSGDGFDRSDGGIRSGKLIIILVQDASWLRGE